MGINGLVHDVSPPKITSIRTALITTWAIAMGLMAPSIAYAWEQVANSEKDSYSYEKPAKEKKSGFEGKVEVYSFKEYLDGVDASENPWMKIEWKWKLDNGMYAGGGITQSFSDKWEWKINFGNTRYIKWGWKGKVEGIGVHAWWAVADTAVWDFWDANFTKGTLELSKWDFTAIWYLSGIESEKKWKKWYTKSTYPETKWTNGWWVWASYHFNDNIDLGFMTGKEAKSQMQFNEIIAGVKYEVTNNLYLEGHLEYQLQWSEAWNMEPRIALTYKIKPKKKKKSKGTKYIS